MLKWATEEVDNPDLRDRGYMYWRLLAQNPTGAGDIVLAEKPAISTDTDRMERGALDQLLLHTGTLASIYHKNPEVIHRKVLHFTVLPTLHFTDIYSKCEWQSIDRQSCTEPKFTKSANPFISWDSTSTYCDATPT